MDKIVLDRFTFTTYTDFLPNSYEDHILTLAIVVDFYSHIKTFYRHIKKIIIA